jgi:hypothetical protein
MGFDPLTCASTDRLVMWSSPACPLITATTFSVLTKAALWVLFCSLASSLPQDTIILNVRNETDTDGFRDAFMHDYGHLSGHLFYRPIDKLIRDIRLNAVCGKVILLQHATDIGDDFAKSDDFFGGDGWKSEGAYDLLAHNFSKRGAVYSL